MILFQTIDHAAKRSGEPHVAPSWEIAKASLGFTLAKDPELAERARAIEIQYVGPWDPETGIGPVFVPEERESARGDVCLAEFVAACRRDEEQKQAEADDLGQLMCEERHRVTRQAEEKSFFGRDSVERNHQIMLEHASKEDEDE